MGFLRLVTPGFVSDNVIPFDREARLYAELTPEQTVRRCRLAAVCAGCNNAQRAAIENFAWRLIGEGLDPHGVIVRARSMAELMARTGSPKVLA